MGHREREEDWRNGLGNKMKRDYGFFLLEIKGIWREIQKGKES
jgi:hypothetical protein